MARRFRRGGDQDRAAQGRRLRAAKPHGRVRVYQSRQEERRDRFERGGGQGGVLEAGGDGGRGDRRLSAGCDGTAGGWFRRVDRTKSAIDLLRADWLWHRHGIFGSRRARHQLSRPGGRARLDGLKGWSAGARGDTDRGSGGRIDAGGDRDSTGAGGAASDRTRPARGYFDVRGIGGDDDGSAGALEFGKAPATRERFIERTLCLLSDLRGGRRIVRGGGRAGAEILVESVP